MQDNLLTLRQAYIRIFGAAGAALDVLEKAPLCKEVEHARQILTQAIEETEEFVELN